METQHTMATGPAPRRWLSLMARAAGVLAGAALVLLLFGARLAVGAADWLDTGEPPEPADLIVVPAGGAQERLSTALTLYRRGFGRALLLTDEAGYPDQQIEELVAAGVPERAILPPPRPAASTLQDAACIREVILRQNVRSILVVTSPYHCRRVKMILSRRLADLDVAVRVTRSVSLYWDLREWWRQEDGREAVSGEYVKLAWDWMTVPQVAGVRQDGQGK
jgi:uncharacterized SAM-binding protein YcdF (DUF218 family)